MPNSPFEPVTKKRAAALLQVSIRTIDYWIEQEQDDLPAPVHIGRQCYWHPEIFFKWLTTKLKGVSADSKIKPRNGEPAALSETSLPVAEKAPADPIKQAPRAARRSGKPGRKSSTKRRRMSVDELNAP